MLRASVRIAPWRMLAFQAPQRLAPSQADLPANLMEKMIEKDRRALTPEAPINRD